MPIAPKLMCSPMYILRCIAVNCSQTCIYLFFSFIYANAVLYISPRLFFVPRLSRAKIGVRLRRADNHINEPVADPPYICSRRPLTPVRSPLWTLGIETFFEERVFRSDSHIMGRMPRDRYLRRPDRFGSII